MSSPIDNSWPSPPCGNINELIRRSHQEDAAGNVCVNVCIAPVSGDLCIYASGENDPIGTEHCFISYLVPNGKTLIWSQIIASFPDFGEFLIKVEGTIIMRLVTSPGSTNVSINLTPSKPISSGDTIEVCFCGPCKGDFSASIIGQLT